MKHVAACSLEERSGPGLPRQRGAVLLASAVVLAAAAAVGLAQRLGDVQQVAAAAERISERDAQAVLAAVRAMGVLSTKRCTTIKDTLQTSSAGHGPVAWFLTKPNGELLASWQAQSSARLGYEPKVAAALRTALGTPEELTKNVEKRPFALRYHPADGMVELLRPLSADRSGRSANGSDSMQSLGKVNLPCASSTAT